ncbi:MAG: tetratricopeptide repeat protein [Cyanobacteria bacterium RM1_2_2]|nr:tetratricopeptide repeat protein [Cyanobacteria bacterium RM1_2_2]
MNILKRLQQLLSKCHKQYYQNRYKKRDRQRRNSLAILAVFTFIFTLQPFSNHALLSANPIHPAKSPLLVAQRSVSENSLIEQGRQHYQAGQYPEAITFWQQALVEAAPLQQALCFNYLALAYLKLADWQQAEQAIAQSFQRLADRPSSPLLAQAFNIQGQVQLGRGQPEAALASWQQAETYYTAADDLQGQLGSQINQAQALQTLGLYRRAQSLLEAINRSLQAQPDAQLKALGLSSLGTVLQVAGNLTESQQVLQQSLAIAEQLNLRSQISEIQFNLANTLRSLQSTDAALQLYQQAANTALTPLGHLQAQLNRFSLLLDTQQDAQAQTLAAQLQPQFNQLAPSRDAAYLQVNFATQLSKLAAQTPQTDAIQTDAIQTATIQTAAQLLTRTIQQAQSLSDVRAESYAVGQLAHLYEQTQQWETAQSLSQRALLLAQSINADDIAYRWQWQLGRILKQRDPTAAKATYSEALKTLDLIRRDLLSTHPEFQVSFRSDVEPLYRELVELLVQPNAPPF